MGRPTKRTPERQDAIVEALSKGYTRVASAAHAGMTYQTLREWEKDDVEFSDALEKAEGIAQGRLIDKIAADKSWQSAAWQLERRWPDQYSIRSRVEMTGKDGGPIEHADIDALSDHEKDILSEVIRAELARRSELARRADASLADAAVVHPVEAGTEGT